MTSSLDEIGFDPRLGVFVIWGIFFFLFVCIPILCFSSHRLALALLQWLNLHNFIGFTENLVFGVGDANLAMGSLSGRQGDDDNSWRYGGGGGIDYKYLSNKRKREIDDLRLKVVGDCLVQFSLELEVNDMIQSVNHASSKNSVQKSRESALTVSSVFGCENTQETNCLDCKISTNKPLKDVEKGNESMVLDESDEKGWEKEAEDAEGLYTHILVPFPGTGIGCANCEKKALNKNNKEKHVKKCDFFRKNKKERQNNSAKFLNHLKHSDDQKNASYDTNIEQGERGSKINRKVPVFCAICLLEYEPSEKVSWSSNKECTHVFHHECILQWIIALGRTKSKMRSFCETLSERQSLNYPPECPCCRQDFIGRNVLSDLYG